MTKVALRKNIGSGSDAFVFIVRVYLAHSFGPQFFSHNRNNSAHHSGSRKLHWKELRGEFSPFSSYNCQITLTLFYRWNQLSFVLFYKACFLPE